MVLTITHLLVASFLALTGLWTGPPTSRVAGPLAGPLAGPPAAAEAAVWPLDPRPVVVDRFSPPAQEWGAGHRGVDLLGDPGQVVRAAQPGSVTFAGRLAGRGVVVVGHGPTRTTYEPVTASVSVGDRVRAGQPIGSLETFGSHCWPVTCLHWGLIEGETYLDPLTLVGAGLVRLLPLYSWLPLPWERLLRPAGVPGGTPGATGPW